MTDQTDAPATDDGPLSSEDAIALIEGKEAPAEAQEAAPDAENAAAEGDDAPEPEEATEGEEKPEEAAAEVIPPPPFWSAEDKEAFGKAPPEVQKAILDHEANRNKAAERFIQANTQAASEYTAKAKALDELLAAAEQNEELFGRIDWNAWLRENPGEALAAQNTAQQLKAAKAEADQRALAEFQAEEGRKLPTIDPELADTAKLTAVYSYIAQLGVPQAQLPHASALELAIAHKAMKWDAAQAAAKAGKPRVTEPPRKPVKPAAAQPGTSQQRSLETLNRRFAQTRSSADAIELIIAKGL